MSKKYANVGRARTKRPRWSDWWRDWAREHNDLAGGAAKRAILRRAPFLLDARISQRPPVGDWRTWLFLGGRGAGKTRAGAEWVRFAAEFGGARRIALIGPTLGDVREVMIEGISGLKAVAAASGDAMPRYEVSRRRLTWPSGATASAFSAEDPDSLRGPQFDLAWCDELAAWRDPQASWDMLQMALRSGARPRAMVTTTPRPIPLLRSLLIDRVCAVTRAATAENADNLAPGFLEAVERAYAGTRLGRQELEGELLASMDGALWTRSGLLACRVLTVPDELAEVIVAVDPPAGAGPGVDACGIVAAGRVGGAPAGTREVYVLADGSVQGLAPLDWAGRVAALARRVGAREVVAEANQGGEMVRQTLETAGCTAPVRLVHASVGKWQRALPVSALYAQGRVGHVGDLQALEDEMCSFGLAGAMGSPDRMDALVWAVWALALDMRAVPAVRRL